MSVGDIGILQNFTRYPHFNGTPAEILMEINPEESFSAIKYDGEKLSVTFCYNGYYVSTYLGVNLTIQTHQIRPITDPDQQQTITHDEEIPA